MSVVEGWVEEDEKIWWFCKADARVMKFGDGSLMMKKLMGEY